MRRKKELLNESSEEKILDVNASMQGTLRFDDPVNLRINGKFEGTLDTKGKLMIGRGAEIKANITGESISISGGVKGNIKAATVLKLEESAVVNGDIETPSISIAEGALLNGRLRMSGADSGTSSGHRGNWMTTGQLADYLEVDEDRVNEWANSAVLPATREGAGWVFDRSKVDQWIAEGKVKP